MAFLIDTNIAIHARDGTDSVLEKLAKPDGIVLISALNLVELGWGVYKNPSYAALRWIRLDALTENIPVIPFDVAGARIYGQCGRVKGRDHDGMIAAHAISTGSILVTNNEGDFPDIPGLKIENWIYNRLSRTTL